MIYCTRGIFFKHLSPKGDSFFFSAETYDLLPTSPEYDFSVFFFPSGWKKKTAAETMIRNWGQQRQRYRIFFPGMSLGPQGSLTHSNLELFFPQKYKNNKTLVFYFSQVQLFSHSLIFFCRSIIKRKIISGCHDTFYFTHSLI